MGATRKWTVSLLGGILVVVVAAGWLLRRRALVRVDTPNAYLKVVDVKGGEARPVFTHALAIDTTDGWWLVLSSAPIDCGTALDIEQDPYPKDTARLFLEHPPVTSAVEFPTDGIPSAEACTHPSKMPERPRTSTLTIDASSPGRVKGRLRVDQEGVIPGHKRCFDFVRSYHWVGEGTFDAPVCRLRAPWKWLR